MARAQVKRGTRKAPGKSRRRDDSLADAWLLLLQPQHIVAEYYKEVLDGLRPGKNLDKAIKDGVKELLTLQDRLREEAREFRYRAVEIQSRLVDRYINLLKELDKKRKRSKR